MDISRAVVHAPSVVRRLFGGRPVSGVQSTTADVGTVWQPSSVAGVPVIVVFSTEPKSLAWIASVLAAQLPAVVVVAGSVTDPVGTLAAASTLAGQLGADASRVGVVGEGVAAASAVLAAASSTTNPTPATSERSDRAVDRIALISPRKIGDTPTKGTPPTLLQFAQDGDAAPESALLERRLREAGVAVRSIDYTAVGDGWVKYPRAIRGARRGQTDLVAFFRRGLGDESTFDVIPGWDLH
jgi:acetyl esterase/lipase